MTNSEMISIVMYGGCALAITAAVIRRYLVKKNGPRNWRYLCSFAIVVGVIIAYAADSVI